MTDWLRHIRDTDEPCDGCGAQWVRLDPSQSRPLVIRHDPDCHVMRYLVAIQRMSDVDRARWVIAHLACTWSGDVNGQDAELIAADLEDWLCEYHGLPTVHDPRVMRASRMSN